MTGANCDEGVFERCLFEETKVDLASFRFAKMAKCDFINCNLREIDFQGAEFAEVRFRNCDLSGAQFSQAKFKQVDLRSSDIGGIGFSLNSLKGLIVDPLQCETFARHLGLQVETVIVDNV